MSMIKYTTIQHRDISNDTRITLKGFGKSDALCESVYLLCFEIEATTNCLNSTFLTLYKHKFVM